MKRVEGSRNYDGPAVLEKLTFGLATVVLFAQDRIPGVVVAFGGVDLLLAAFFTLAFVCTSPSRVTPHANSAA